MYRFALSPTEDMHLGNLRVALLNYLCAKKDGARFHVRIMDNNKARNGDGKDQEMLNTLAVFGIAYDVLHYQSEALKFHHQCAASLLSNGKAFSCFCTSQTLKTKEKIAKSNGEAYLYDGTCETLSNEEVLNNEGPFTVRIKASTQNPERFVLLHHDKSPTEDFACAVDDMLQGVGVVLDDEECVARASKHEYIRHSLGFNETLRTVALPVLLNTKGEKMGAQDDGWRVDWLLEQGFLPQAISNYLLLLSTNAPCELFTAEEALAWLDASKGFAPSAPFDIRTLRHLNREHLLRMEDAKLAALLDFSGADFGKLAKIYAKEAPTLKELKPKLHAIFSPKVPPKGAEEAFKTLQNALLQAPHCQTLEVLRAHLELTCKGESSLELLYVLLTGSSHGPALEELYPLITPYLKEIVRS
ncbi:glutamate--tRNA ligase [Sulfurospirillum sp. T05]|uniref:Glutamate--tRNA ligase n=1 Tax=Sulfurospirillum tamanense TaxID=2813362 RepID=A0ABS2WT77_9BACT|nr:glutamate--tRNA ligase family protein [Sulfurospirillum tamanensis]MBN2964725.1 glutamate--tRNA ligase [Sulfurospirillum tamanensis]